MTKIDKFLIKQGNAILRKGEHKRTKTPLDKIAPAGLMSQLMTLLDSTSPVTVMNIWRNIKDPATSFEEFLEVTKSEHFEIFSKMLNSARKKITIYFEKT